MFQIKEVGVLYVINLISFLLSVVGSLGFSFPLLAINWVSARRISTKIILHYDIITLWHYEISSHFVKVTTFKIFHLKNMPFHKAWQASRHFSQAFFACIYKGKGNYWWVFHVIWHIEIPVFLDSYVFQYLNNICQLIQRIILWPFSHFQTMWHMVYGCFYWRAYFCDLRVKCHASFTRRIFFDIFSYNIRKRFQD